MKSLMKTTVLYVGSSLLAPLRHAEGEINRRHGLGLRVAAHNLGAPLAADEWALAERDLSESEVVERLREIFSGLEDQIEGVA